MMLYLNGTAMTQLKSDENGIVAVLRDPPTRDEALFRQGQDVLAMTKAEKLVTVNFDNVPLKDAIKQLAQSTGRNIVLEKPELTEESLTERTPITLAVNQVKLDSALKLMLDPLNLGYRVDESGVIVVTSQQRLRGEAIVKIYAVADLVIPIPKHATLMLNRNARLADEIRASRETVEDHAKKSQPRLRELIDLITETCQPDSWSEMLRLQAAATKPNAEVDFEKLAAFTLESGHSLLLDVTEVYSVGATSGVSILSKVPRTDRLVKNTDKSDSRTLLLITGQAIVVE